MIGPIVLLPWGLALYTLIGCAVIVVIGEIWWKLMKHEPEDEQAYSEGNTFVIESDFDEGKGK